MTRLALVLAALLLAVGCKNHHRYLTRQFRLLHPECRDGDIGSERRREGEEVFLVRGCGVEDTAHHVCSTRCAYHFESVVRRRAAFSTSCPEESLVITELSPHEIGVEGCGVREVYEASPSGWIPRSEPERVPVR